MTTAAWPASFAREPVTTWMVIQANPRPTYRGYAQRYAELLYEWAEQRSGELDPDDRTNQEAAAVAYADKIIRASTDSGMRTTGALSGIFLAYILPAILQALARALLSFVLDKDVLPQWQQFVASGRE